GAGPILSTGPYTITLPTGDKFEVAGNVTTGGDGYVYTYTVTNLNEGLHTFELGIAESPSLYGKYSESNPQVTANLGQLLRDKGPEISYGPGVHNYVFSLVLNGHRVGIPVGYKGTITMSFE